MVRKIMGVYLCLCVFEPLDKRGLKHYDSITKNLFPPFAPVMGLKYTHV